MKAETAEYVILVGAPGSGLNLLRESLALLGIGGTAGRSVFVESAARINANLLTALGTVPPAAEALADGWLLGDAAERARVEIAALLEVEGGREGAALLGDPTGFRFIPLWLECFQRAGFTPQIMHIIRHPWEVAQTLRQRYGLPVEEGFRLWLASYHDITELCRGENLYTITFHQLLSDPVNTMRSAGEALHLRYNCDLSKMYPNTLVKGINFDRQHFNAADMSEEDLDSCCVFTRLYSGRSEKLDPVKIYRAGEVPPHAYVEGHTFVIRSVHHLSGTGGTMICKAIAAMHNVVLLSELHPNNAGGIKFNPFDPLQHFQAAYPELKCRSNLELQNYFLQRLRVVVDRCRDNGKNLVIRDHSHSDFLINGVSPRNYLLDALTRHYEVKPIITIRNPVDVYLSFVNNREQLGWVTDIESFDQYCERMLKFMDRYAFADFFLYEDFVRDPDSIMCQICALLNIEFNSNYRRDMGKITLTGDSGRAQGTKEISVLERREYPEEFRIEVEMSYNFRLISQRTGYRL